MQFSSFGAFADHITKLAHQHEKALKESLERIAVHVEKVAKEEFGHYQEAAGPFPAWPELAESTKEDRVRLGFTENDPLLRNGALRDSIKHEVKDLKAAVGSTSPVMVTQELGGEVHSPSGTHIVPPRPVLGSALVRSKDFIRQEVGHASASALLPTGAGLPGGPTAADYNMET